MKKFLFSFFVLLSIAFGQSTGGIGIQPVERGGTGSTTITAAREKLGIYGLTDGNVQLGTSGKGVLLHGGASITAAAGNLTVTGGAFNFAAPTPVTNADLSASSVVYRQATTAASGAVKRNSVADVVNLLNVAFWGDSLTAGAGSTVPYPSYFQSATGFTAYNGGVGGETSTQIKTRFLADTSRLSNPVVLWPGRNNYASPTTVKADIAAMVAALGHENYLVLSILNGDYSGNEYSGQNGYNIIAALNADLATIYGVHFVDVRTPLVAAYNAALPQDVIDHGHDIPPSSLRYDAIHLNNAGYLIVAQTVANAFSNLRGVNNPVATLFTVLDLLRKFPVIAEALAVKNYVSSPELQFSGTKVLRLSGNGLLLQFNGGFIPSANATYDLGENGVPLKWRDLFLSRDLSAGGTIYGAGLSISGGGTFTGTVSATSFGIGAQAAFLAGNNSTWQFSGTGLSPQTDNVADLGFSAGLYRWRDLWLSRDASVANRLTALKARVTGTVDYADNAAALAAGLVAGDLYRTGDALKIVH